jgi:formate C-acetyltransferase
MRMRLTTRLKRMHRRLFDEEFHTKKTWYFDGETILIGEELRKEPLVVRKAKAIDFVAKNLPAYIKKDELITGNPNECSVGFGVVFPTYATEEELEKARSYSLDPSSVWGHHPPRWEKVVNEGLASVKNEIEKAIRKELLRTAPRQEVLDEYRAMITSLNAVIVFAHRHAEVALRESLNETDPIRRRELFEIYQTCSRVPEFAATNYQEALQGYWFTYCILSSAMEFIPLARTDQIVYPYYARDMKERRITKEHAIDLTGSFLVKCNERIMQNMKYWENHFTFGQFSQGLIPEDTAAAKVTGSWSESRTLMWQEGEDINSDANFNFGQSGNDWLMNMMVGGVKPDGTDGTNELSYLIVDLMDAMGLVMPTVAARIHKDTPKRFLEKVAEVLRFGTGEPAIYNDDAIIPGFVDLGVPVEDANDYSNDGCWETLIPGKSHFSYAHVENLLCLEWVLTRGESLVRDSLKEGLDTGDPLKLKTWEAFYEAYKKQVDARIDFCCKRRLENFGLSNMIAPDPLISALMDDCVDRGKDLTKEGAKYNFHLLLITGLSHTVDSLAVIKKLVYEEKSVKIEELIQAIRDNWKGHELLRARVGKRVPKFGNDDPYVDEIAVKVLSDFQETVNHWNRKQDKLMFPCGIGTFENYAILGRRVGPSADGRLAKDPLAPNYTPSPGFDADGPTAVFRSITRPELMRYYCGTPVDITVNSNEFQGEAGIQRMAGLIKSFCELGGQILTITSCNVDTLRDAQKQPEKHRDLRVRLGGLSAYFVCMAPAQQENIIKRFEKGAVS